MKGILILYVCLMFFGQEISSFDGFFSLPSMTLTVRFKSVPPVVENIFTGNAKVFYRGYKVGEVSDINLSCDQKCIVFNINITYKDLKLPVNTKVVLKTEDIFGDRYLELVYPQKPSSELLKSGDIIEGTAIYERLDKYLVEEMESGELGVLISNLTDLSVKLNKEDLGPVLKYATSSLKGISDIMAQEGFAQAIAGAPASLANTGQQIAITNRLLPQVNKNLVSTNKSFADANIHISDINQSLTVTNSELNQTNCELNTLNPKIPVIPDSLICQTERTLKRYDCIGEALSETLSKNCLLFRLMFGNPGKPFKACTGCEPCTTTKE